MVVGRMAADTRACSLACALSFSSLYIMESFGTGRDCCEGGVDSAPPEGDTFRALPLSPKSAVLPVPPAFMASWTDSEKLLRFCGDRGVTILLKIGRKLITEMSYTFSRRS